ncbi:N-acetyltransferase [bacterium]|nr:MAG: N-acetyltransferase [bacterium]MCL4232411.1 GNAT family N-acetyltransferase [Dehalococcoidia bacterium]
MAGTDTGARIRVATTGDAASIASLVTLAYRVEDFFVYSDRTDEAEVDALLARDRFLVAEDESGTMLGCIHLTEKNGRGYFGMLSVHPVAQARGLGKELVARAEAHFAARGLTGVDILVVNLREELPAWYGRLGYRQTGTLPYDPPSKVPCHFLVLSKELAPPKANDREVTP